MPKHIHLWIYNHQMFGISDQVEFFLLTMRQHGFAVTIGKSPRADALNVVIENFSELTSKTLIDFCKSTGKKVAVIMTEHLDFVENQIFIHGEPLWNNNDYMHPAVQFSRIKNLMDCVEYIRAFIVLGDLPVLKNIDQMFVGIPVHALPFPRLRLVTDLDSQAPKYDAIFTGVVTAYRATTLQQIEQNMTVFCPGKFVSRRARDKLNSSGKIVLNLPQRLDWKWLSLMRIIAALQCGRATFSLGTCDSTKIAACCEQIDISQPDWVELLHDRVLNWQTMYHKAFGQYAEMAQEFEAERPFPFQLFDYWGIIEDHLKLKL